jgi:protease II
MAESRSPPVAKKVEHVMEMFGDVRVDNYYWLRDDSRTNPDMLSYLREENHYTDFVMSGESFQVASVSDVVILRGLGFLAFLVFNLEY